MKRSLYVVTLLASMMVITPSAHATLLTFNASLSGPNEFPANTSPGTGTAVVTFDDLLHIMTVDVSFSGLLGTTTASHIHCCTTVPLTGTAGVATTTPTFAGFPLGVTSGTYFISLDMTIPSSYNPAFVTASGGTTALAEAALFSGLSDGRSYLNIHTSLFGGGEIRGFLTQVTAPVPEPATLALLGLGLAGMGFARRPA